MAKRRKKPFGMSPDNYRALARNFMSSAQQNFNRIRERHVRADSCGLIEHYTDVVAEAVTAEAIAFEAGDRELSDRARKLASTATRAQRGAVAACRQGVKVR